MDIKINLTKRRFFLTVMMLFFLGGILGVRAYTAYYPHDPSDMGHTGEEIDVDYNGPKTLNEALADIESDLPMYHINYTSENFVNTHSDPAHRINPGSVECTPEYPDVVGGMCWNGGAMVPVSIDNHAEWSYPTDEDGDGLGEIKCKGTESPPGTFHYQVTAICGRK